MTDGQIPAGVDSDGGEVGPRGTSGLAHTRGRRRIGRGLTTAPRRRVRALAAEAAAGHDIPAAPASMGKGARAPAMRGQREGGGDDGLARGGPLWLSHIRAAWQSLPRRGIAAATAS